MARKWPAWKPDFTGNLAALEADLLELEKQIQMIVTLNPDRPLMASHPVYQYLQRRHGLNLKSMMWEPDEMPDEAQWAALAQALSDHPARWMIWESEPSRQIVKRLQGMGVESVVFDPAGNRPDAGDFLSVMGQNVTHLKRAYQ